MLEEHNQQTNKTHPQKKRNKKKRTVFALYFPLSAHHSCSAGICTQAVWVHKSYSGAEVRASQQNSRNSHILLYGTTAQKLNHSASQHPLGQSRHSAGSHHMQPENNALFSMFSRYFLFTFFARGRKLQWTLVCTQHLETPVRQENGLESSKTWWEKHTLTIHSFSGFQEVRRSKQDAPRDVGAKWS